MSPRTLRSVISTLVVLGLAAWALLANQPVLGLDLQGGVTMRYELQPPDDLPTGSDVNSLIDSTIETLRQRIDTYGIRESTTVRQGERELVIELPGKGKDEAETIKSVISRVGRLEFRIVAYTDERSGLNVDDETRRLTELLDASKGKSADEIDVTPLDRRFPDVLYRWVPYSDRMLAERRNVASTVELESEAGPMGKAPLVASDYLLIRKESSPARNFTGADIATAGLGNDPRGGRAVSIALRGDRSSDFADFSGDNIGQAMAILLDDRIAQSPARINDRLDGQFVIESGQLGGFSEREVKDYLTVIRSGSLQMKPKLLFENTIGPSLGEASIESGTQAVLLALLVVAVFMIGYYRWHGVHAVVTLLVNMTVLGAIMVFLGATITLPGLAGLVLTFGMAVDANILIYERMREEKDRAHSPGQVIKLGFEKALSTILDSNVTTFIVAIILYKLGSGPVRGFAVVLMLGLITSVWAALVVGRMLYDVMLETGRLKTIGSMGRFLPPDMNIPFLKIGWTCLKVSTLMVIACVVIFFVSGDEKYGLDFVGGYKAQVRLAQAVPQKQVKELMDTVFPGAQVVSVTEPDSADPSRTRQFIIKVKSLGEQAPTEEGTTLGERYEKPMKQALASLLLPDFVTGLQLEENAEAGTTAVSGTLHFEGAVDPAVVQKGLTTLAQVETAAEGPDAVGFKGTLAGIGQAPQLVTQRLRTALDNATGLPPLSTPVLESTAIGGRVGVELRDSAIRALLLSFVAIVLYVKVRFKEYSYGIAGVLALVHDVLITLGGIIVARWLGIVDVEIDLTMIAVFLTIVGYSINDTIVLFDRVRENLPRLNKPLPEVIDISMNQVLSRSILTAATVFITLLVLFIMNYGKQTPLEGFSFAMLIGVVAGTYSSIYIACPLLLLFAEREQRKAKQAQQAPAAARQAAKTEAAS